jgi:prepilin-type N-terminal cleavage/methylation domain-containing protein
MSLRSALRAERGFTLIEMLVSVAIMVAVTGAIFSLVDPSRGTYQQQPQVSDMQQRMRVGTTFLTNDLLMAGAGAPAGGELLGTLLNYFAPIQPIRVGWLSPDIAAGTLYRDDAITLMHIPYDAPHTTVEDPMPQPSSEIKVFEVTSCDESEANYPLCRFYDGLHAIIFDETGAWDDMVITEVQTGSVHLQHNKSIEGNTFSKKYQTGAQIAQLSMRTYYLNAATNQLMSYDGYLRDEAVIDNVVDLEFEYWGDPRPPYVTDLTTLATTYGPRPPKLGTTPSGSDTWPWGPGANCVFEVDPGTGQHAPRLTDLVPGSQALVLLTEELLTDGPFCPEDTVAARFDADLLRIRKVGVRLRVQVESANLRGPASALFANPGTGITARSLVPDQEIRFEITPRNFNLGR